MSRKKEEGRKQGETAGKKIKALLRVEANGCRSRTE